MCKFRALIPALFLGVLLAGCSSKADPRFVGHYTGKVQLEQAMKDEIIKRAGKDGPATIKQIESATTSLDLKEDKTFVRTVNARGQTQQVDGTWSISDKVLSLSNKGTNKVEELNASDDAKTLTEVNSGLPGAQLVYTKG